MMGRTISATQRAKFLKQLAKVPNVSLAARNAGFAPRTAYEMRDRDPEFKEAWQNALDAGVADLHAKVWDRSLNGVESYVVSQGRVVMHNGKPLVERKFQDNIAMRLLQAHMPEYASTPDKPSDVPPELTPDPPAKPDDPDAPEVIE